MAFEIIAPEPSQVHDLVEEAFAVEAASWKRAAGTAMTVSPWRSSFYRRLGDYAASEGVPPVLLSSHRRKARRNGIRI